MCNVWVSHSHSQVIFDHLSVTVIWYLFIYHIRFSAMFGYLSQALGHLKEASRHVIVHLSVIFDYLYCADIGDFRLVLKYSQKSTDVFSIGLVCLIMTYFWLQRRADVLGSRIK